MKPKSRIAVQLTLASLCAFLCFAMLRSARLQNAVASLQATEQREEEVEISEELCAQWVRDHPPSPGAGMKAVLDRYLLEPAGMYHDYRVGVKYLDDSGQTWRADCEYAVTGHQVGLLEARIYKDGHPAE